MRTVSLGPGIGATALLVGLIGGPEPRARPPQEKPTSPGAVLYQTYCAACHGRTGRGDGALAAQLSTRSSDLTTLSRRNGGSFPSDAVYRAIDGRRPIKSHGPMPAWADAFAAGTRARRDTRDGARH